MIGELPKIKRYRTYINVVRIIGGNEYDQIAKVSGKVINGVVILDNETLHSLWYDNEVMAAKGLLLQESQK